MGKPLIVVLGAGLGGTIASYEIKAAVKDYYDKNGIKYDHSKFPDCAGCEGACCMV